jgi:hypothetical protein
MPAPNLPGGVVLTERSHPSGSKLEQRGSADEDGAQESVGIHNKPAQASVAEDSRPWMAHSGSQIPRGFRPKWRR